MNSPLASTTAEPLLRELLRVLPTPALLVERGTIASANERAATLLGSTPGELVGKNLDACVTASGRHLHVEANALDERLSVATLHDRTSELEAEQALRKEEEILSQVLRSAPGVVYSFRIRPDGHRSIPFASIGIETLFGLTREVLAENAQALWDRIPAEDLAHVESAIVASATAFTPFAADFRVLVDGELRWVEARSTPTREADGGMIWHGFATDITAERRAAEALREAEARFAQAFRMSPIGLTMTSLSDMRILECNEAYLQMWNLKREDVIGAHVDTLPAQPPPDVHARLHDELVKNQMARDVEYAFVQRDGSVGHATLSVTIIERQGAPYVLTMISDVTARKRSEAERSALEDHLRQAQKLESIGRLAGGIAHDFNNWLTVISGCTEELGERVARDSGAEELLVETRHAIERASSLTRDLLAFSRQEVLDPKVVDLNEIVTDAARMLRRVLGEDVVLAMELDRTAGLVRIDRNHWSSVLLNLCVNARDAMPKGGIITIRTRAGEGAESGLVLLEVTDTGSGFGPEVQSRLFEPFFTTKGKAGTGLGLAVVHGIVEQSGGKIDVTSVPEVGTTFVIRVPTVAMKETRQSEGPAASGRGKGTILIAEDEDMVRRLAGRVLRANGFDVLEAANGFDALDVLDRSPSVDLLFTDLVMPGMTGRELAEEALRRRPSIALLYTTGYTQDAVARIGIQRSEVAFLQKPFTPATLVAAVHEVLSERRPHADP